MKKAIKKSISLFSNFKLNSSSKKFKHSQTKIVFSNFSFKKNKITRANSYLKKKQKKKASSFSINRDNLKIYKLEEHQSKDLINIRRKSVTFQPFEKRKKQFTKLLSKNDKSNVYLKYMKNKIFKNLYRKYSSPYIYVIKEKEKNQNKKPVEYSNYYNYYLISNLIEKKKNRFNLYYYENLYLYNKQEYLIKYFNHKEIYIIMNYLLFQIYDKDIATIANNAKKLLTNKEINIMFNNLIKNNYSFQGTMEILKGIAVYYKFKKNNSPNINKTINLEKIKPIAGQKINYIFIKDIPYDILPNCIPHYYLFKKEEINYMKDFTNKRKYKKINEFNENSQLQEKNKRKKQYYDINKISKNFLSNISFFLSKDESAHEESKDYKEIKYRQNAMLREKNDNDNEVREFERLTEKISSSLKNNNENSIIKNYSEKIARKVFKLRSHRAQSVLEIPQNYVKRREKVFKTSKLKNAYALNIRDLKKIFKTSLIHSGTTYYNYLVNLKNINENNLSNNKNNKNIKHHLNNNERRKNFKEFENISNLKYNIYNKNKRNKDSKTLRRFDGLKNDHVNNIISFKEVSSNDSLSYNKIKNISNFIAQTNKNKYSINKHFSLKKLTSLSTKKFSTPKNIKYYKPIRQAFSPYSGMVFENKEVNIWENNKIDTDIINVAVKTSYLLKKLGNSFNNDFKSFSNSNTLKKLIKYPQIYFSNYK